MPVDGNLLTLENQYEVASRLRMIVEQLNDLIGQADKLGLEVELKSHAYKIMGQKNERYTVLVNLPI